jgi:hypothetical protein
MRNMLYKQNGKRNLVAGGLMALVMAIGGTAACGSNHNTASVACADTAEMAFTLSSSGHHGSSSSGGTSGKSKSNTSSSSRSGSSSSGSSSSGSSGSSSSGSSSGSSTSGSSGRYGSNGGTNGGSTTTTSGSSGTTNRYGSNGSTTSGTGNTGTTRNSVPTPPKGTTRVTVPGEKAYTPPSNKVAQPKGDLKAAQKSVTNRRFLAKKGSYYSSPVTGHRYYYHPYSYYTIGVYQDLYNVYDPRNYHNSGYGTLLGHFSPFWKYSWKTSLVAHC